MPAKLIEQKNNTLTIQFTVELTGQMLNDEQALQQSLNEAGQAAMGRCSSSSTPTVNPYVSMA